MKKIRILCVLMSLVVSMTSLSGCMELLEGVETVSHGAYTESVESIGATVYPSGDSEASQHKIFENVWAAEPTEEGERLVAVFLKPLDGETVNHTVKERYGVDLAPYMDADLYEATVYPYLEAELKRVVQACHNVIIPREEMLTTIRAKTAEEAEAEDRANYRLAKQRLQNRKGYEWYPTVLLLELGFDLEAPVWGDVANCFLMELTPEEKALLEAQRWVDHISEFSNESWGDMGSMDGGNLYAEDGTIASSEDETLGSSEGGKSLHVVFCTGFGATSKTPEEAAAYFLREMYGYDADVYGDRSRYEAEYLPALAKIAMENSRNPETPVDRSKVPFDRMGMTPWQENQDPNVVILYEMADIQCKDKEEIAALRLLTVSELCREQTTEFLSDMAVDPDDVYETDQYTATVFLWATENELLKYAACEQVDTISLWDPNSCISTAMESEDPLSSAATRATNTVASTSAILPSTSFSGVGVKIGVIESAKTVDGERRGLRFDPQAPQLQFGRFTYVPNVKDNTLLLRPVVDDHATMVVSVLAGGHVLARDEGLDEDSIYYGIAPDAEVYQTNFDTSDQMLNALNLLAACGVSVINMSLGVSDSNTMYASMNQYVDTFVRNTWISVVISAGNHPNREVMTPGRSYNAITVGNAQTVSNSGYMLEAPYSLWMTSAYKDGNFLSNKPDIVAPGTEIGFVLSQGEVTRDTGTSVAAPIVTGVLAQMIQAGSAWLYHTPEVLKAVLLVTADPTLIDDPSDEVCVGTSCVMDMSGAGMVDVAAATNMMVSARNQAFVAMISGLPQQPINPSYTVELQSGDVLRCAMTYENAMASPNMQTNFVNYELVLRSPAGDVVAFSRSPYNNVEILEYTAIQAGVYTIALESPHLSGLYPSGRLLYMGIAYTVD